MILLTALTAFFVSVNTSSVNKANSLGGARLYTAEIHYRSPLKTNIEQLSFSESQTHMNCRAHGAGTNYSGRFSAR
jgi:hypothetical protein